MNSYMGFDDRKGMTITTASVTDKVRSGLESLFEE
jgi:hypothetical protein